MKECGCGCKIKIPAVDSRGRIRKYFFGHQKRHRLRAVEKIQCGCGCGTMIDSVDKKNRPKSYVWGHGNMVILKEKAIKKGNTPWNKGVKTNNIPWNKGNGEYMSGDKNPYYGKKHSLEIREKMRGARNGNWRNGASTLNSLIRKSAEYIEWRTAIFIRDDRKCVQCESTIDIEADHIRPFSLILKENNISSVQEAIICSELWDIGNGRTLCHVCHTKTDTYGNTKKTR